MKREMAQEFVVGGCTEPQGKRAGLGALLVGYYDRNELDFAGKLGTGFNTKMLLDLRAQLDRIEIDKPPFTKGVGLPRSKVGARSKFGARSKVGNSLRAHWVHPEIVVQVGFIQWTKHNKLRHPRLLGIRNDKHPREAVRE